ncbi:protein takeout-like [Diaphorina citri]|uniref:Protein takeout-like n=2 Tax=Diaphorina citri TaxID=121845 RepID=A0A3Q0J889_DIACI|nr:protein takeout-like [Diaphorina citri]
MKSIFSLVILSICLLVSLPTRIYAAKKSPFGKNLKPCHRSDPKVNECLKNAFNSIMTPLAKGVPQYGIVPLDPLLLKTFDIEQGKSGPIAIDLKFHDLNILGITSAKVKSVSTDFDKYKISLDADLDKPIILDGMYRIKGNILVLPIVGFGKSNLTLTNFRCHMAISAKPIEKDGRTYWQVEEFVFKLKASRLYVKLENLFNGDKALGDNMNRFLNDNWEILLQEMQPAFEDNLAAAFKEITNRMFLKTPIDLILPN